MSESAPAPALPDFLLDPNVVLSDDSKWLHGDAPDYTLSNKNFEVTKTTSWAPGSLEFLIQNLVKNWEKEASYKVDSKQWRTISQDRYDFHLNGGPAMNANDMVRLGTYNALISEGGIKGIYEPGPNMDFAASHRVFKGAMRTFNWEVLEVLGAPPKVSVRWRHWGVMTGNYQAKLSSGRTVFAKASGKTVEVFGITVAEVNDKFQITSLDTYWDPDQMFRQLVSEGLMELQEGEKAVAVSVAGQCPMGYGRKTKSNL